MDTKPIKFKCVLCGYVTETPRKNGEYVHNLRCADVCCNGPVVEIEENVKSLD